MFISYLFFLFQYSQIRILQKVSQNFFLSQKMNIHWLKAKSNFFNVYVYHKSIITSFYGCLHLSFTQSLSSAFWVIKAVIWVPKMLKEIWLLPWSLLNPIVYYCYMLIKLKFFFIINKEVLLQCLLLPIWTLDYYLLTFGCLYYFISNHPLMFKVRFNSLFIENSQYFIFFHYFLHNIIHKNC